MSKNNDILNILANKKVLYAEDEEGIRTNVVEILEFFFEKVVAVSDGRQILDEIEAGQYDVLIFDVYMPHLDGLEALKKIRKTNHKIPVIILSAHTEQEYLWRAVELKISKYLTKPYNKAALIDALETVALELVDNQVLIRFADSCLYDSVKKNVHCDGQDIQLTKNESKLVEYFIQRNNQVVTFEDISNSIWEYEQPTKEAVKSLIKEVRKKIGKECIKNVYGLGYIFEI